MACFPNFQFGWFENQQLSLCLRDSCSCASQWCSGQCWTAWYWLVPPQVLNQEGTSLELTNSWSWTRIDFWGGCKKYYFLFLSPFLFLHTVHLQERGGEKRCWGRGGRSGGAAEQVLVKGGGRLLGQVGHVLHLAEQVEGGRGTWRLLNPPDCPHWELSPQPHQVVSSHCNSLEKRWSAIGEFFCTSMQWSVLMSPWCKTILFYLLIEMLYKVIWLTIREVCW